MIITKKVKIHIKGISIKRYKKLGYNVDTKGLNTINVEDLPKCSNIKVMVKCDNCDYEKELKIQDYYLSFKNNKYCCNKCSYENYKKTMLERYGVENGFQYKDIKEKSNSTKIKLYGDENYNNREKAIETCLDKYGVENPNQNYKIKKKSNNTCLEKYGFETASKNEKVKEKIKKTNLKRWNSTCTLHSEKQIDKIKQIFIDKYGVDNPMKNLEIFLKAQKTALNRKKFKETELLYQGTYELDFLNNYYEKINIENGKSIKIIYNNNKTVYHSDFFLSEKNLIIEIKSSYWYNRYYDKNIIKQKECEKLGYNYIIIIDKNYNDFNKLIMI